MTDMDIYMALLGGLIGGILCWVAEWVWHRRHDDKPYKWTCPQCGFHIASNNLEMTLSIAEKHEIGHRE